MHVIFIVLLVLLVPSFAHADDILLLPTEDVVGTNSEVMYLDTQDILTSAVSKKLKAKTSLVQPLIVRLRKDGTVASSNPVWNMCVSGKQISLGLIKSNRDQYHVRRGHIHKNIPLTCRDYHRGDIHIWIHPDFPNIEMVLTSKGRLLTHLPLGYIAIRGPQIY